jgi:hypothetical protein
MNVTTSTNNSNDREKDDDNANFGAVICSDCYCYGKRRIIHEKATKDLLSGKLAAQANGPRFSKRECRFCVPGRLARSDCKLCNQIFPFCTKCGITFCIERNVRPPSHYQSVAQIKSIADKDDCERPLESMMRELGIDEYSLKWRREWMRVKKSLTRCCACRQLKSTNMWCFLDKQRFDFCSKECSDAFALHLVARKRGIAGSIQCYCHRPMQIKRPSSADSEGGQYLEVPATPRPSSPILLGNRSKSVDFLVDDGSATNKRRRLLTQSLGNVSPSMPCNYSPLVMPCSSPTGSTPTRFSMYSSTNSDSPAHGESPTPMDSDLPPTLLHIAARLDASNSVEMIKDTAD